MAQDGTTYRLLEGHGLLIEHAGELVRLTAGEPVHRAVTEIVELPRGDDRDELPRAA